MQDKDELTTLTEARASVSRFLSNIMIPLSRILMRYGYSARQAEDVAGWSFVRAFWKNPDFWSIDKPTYLQGAIKTGLPRSKVKALNDVPEPDKAVFAHRQNLAYRVVEGWVNDKDFHHGGKPAPLPITHHADPCFKTLVMKYGNDVLYGPVLKDLESAGCVSVVDGIVTLVNVTYGVNLVDEERLELTGYMLRRFIETSEHNLLHETPEDRRLHRVWRQSHVPVEHLKEVQEEVTELAIRAGREADAVMARYSHPEKQPEIQYAEIGLMSSLYIDVTDDR